ncbi:hypothetical protein PYCCODRAFT_1468357 [Trametes coccinea BRFM310]|uniref:Uncharacterized protein n=1 Tax=Trametes coccinea (strain BRFM310) TaxID=1353009 RepID=A0A1Y2IP81_TRAC3|nr:hypothetical protein PYCCODRAFT_1468357 [Trametes coccinea BRFM310]
MNTQAEPSTPPPAPQTQEPPSMRARVRFAKQENSQEDRATGDTLGDPNAWAERFRVSTKRSTQRTCLTALKELRTIGITETHSNEQGEPAGDAQMSANTSISSLQDSLPDSPGSFGQEAGLGNGQRYHTLSPSPQPGEEDTPHASALKPFDPRTRKRQRLESPPLEDGPNVPLTQRKISSLPLKPNTTADPPPLYAKHPGSVGTIAAVLEKAFEAVSARNGQANGDATDSRVFLLEVARYMAGAGLTMEPKSALLQRDAASLPQYETNMQRPAPQQMTTGAAINAEAIKARMYAQQSWLRRQTQATNRDAPTSSSGTTDPRVRGPLAWTNAQQHEQTRTQGMTNAPFIRTVPLPKETTQWDIPGMQDAQPDVYQPTPGHVSEQQDVTMAVDPRQEANNLQTTSTPPPRNHSIYASIHAPYQSMPQQAWVPASQPHLSTSSAQGWDMNWTYSQDERETGEETREEGTLPPPHGRFPRPSVETPYDRARYISAESAKTWNQCPEEQRCTFALYGVFNLEDEALACELCARLESYIFAETGSPCLLLRPVKPTDPAARKRLWPTTWLGTWMMPGAVTQLVNQYAYSFPDLSFYAYKDVYEIPTMLAAVSGFTQLRDDYATMVIREILRKQENQELLRTYATSAKLRQNLGSASGIAEHAANSIRVKCARLSDFGERGKVIAYIYMTSPTDSEQEWTAMKTELVRREFSRPDRRTMIPETCEGCHGVGHLTNQCPFLALNEWHGTPAISNGQDTAYRHPASSQPNLHGRGGRGRAPSLIVANQDFAGRTQHTMSERQETQGQRRGKPFKGKGRDLSFRP